MLVRSLFALVCSAVPAMAGPVVCTTTLEAPPPAADGHAPVEVTRCEPVVTTSELAERRFFSWTAPYARGVDPVHQLSDLLGIAWGGLEGNRVMGFGFPDQTLVWDASAVNNTYESLLEEQSPAQPWRTLDLPNGFNSSLAIEHPAGHSQLQQPSRSLPVDAPSALPLW